MHLHPWIGSRLWEPLRLDLDLVAVAKRSIAVRRAMGEGLAQASLTVLPPTYVPKEGPYLVIGSGPHPCSRYPQIPDPSTGQVK